MRFKHHSRAFSSDALQTSNLGVLIGESTPVCRSGLDPLLPPIPFKRVPLGIKSASNMVWWPLLPLDLFPFTPFVGNMPFVAGFSVPIGLRATV